MVSKDKSTLLSKWYIVMLDSKKPLYAIELKAKDEYNYPKGNNTLEDLKTICSNPVFFNEILAINGIRNIDKNWYSDIIKCFNDSLPETEFNLTNIKDIAVIEEIVKKFYLSVYENKNLHQGIIGGDIWLSYIDLDINKIQEPTVILKRKIKNKINPTENPENKEAKKIDDLWGNQIF